MSPIEKVLRKQGFRYSTHAAYLPNPKKIDSGYYCWFVNKKVPNITYGFPGKTITACWRGLNEDRNK